MIAEPAARVQRLLSWISFAVLALLGPSGAAKHQPGAVIAAYVTAVAAVTVWGMVRAWRTAVIFDETGIVVRNPRRTIRLAWGEVVGLRDGSVSQGDAGEVWALLIETREGGPVVASGATYKREARPETLDALRQVAADRGVAAELTGVPPDPTEAEMPLDQIPPDGLAQMATRKGVELGLCLAGAAALFAAVLLAWPRGVNPHPDYTLSALLGWPTAGLALRALSVYGERRALRHQTRAFDVATARARHETAGKRLDEPEIPADPDRALDRYIRLPATAFFAALPIAIAAGIVLGSHLFIRNSAPFLLFGWIAGVTGYSAAILAGVCLWRLVRRRQFRMVLDADDQRQAVIGCPSYASSRRPSALITSGHECERVRLLAGQNPRWLADDPIRIRPAGRHRGPVAVEMESGNRYLGTVRRVGKVDTIGEVDSLGQADLLHLDGGSELSSFS
ncbi:MAG TPA: PH domain-containing protein [Acidimicrobiales bacterium]|nr:PH domain-containing protein [Acidimicrobiales bacterium]